MLTTSRPPVIVAHHKPFHSGLSRGQSSVKLHTVSQASKLAQVSAGTVRSLTGGKYGSIYAGLWSEDATPGPGGTRLLRDSDIVMLRYIRSQTERGRAHEAIAADIRAGALVDVQLPEEAEEEPEPPEPTPGGEPDPAQGGAMVLYSWGRLLQSQLAAAQERETDMTERLIDAERRAAAAESRAAALADQLTERRRSWWDRLRNR